MAGHVLGVWAGAAWPLGYLWVTLLLHAYTPPQTDLLPSALSRLFWQLCLLPAELPIAAGLLLPLLSRGRWRWLTVLESLLALLSGLALYIALDFLVAMAHMY
jgi:hypothetical protein